MFDFDPKEKSEELVSFIKGAFKNTGFENATIAVSGGIDSATSLYLTVKALGRDHVNVVLLPYGHLNEQGKKDAFILTKSLNIPSHQITTVDIKPFVDKIVEFDPKSDHEEKGRIMARIRMILLYHLAQKNNSLVVGTENKSEHLLGYYTRFGDQASDVEPIIELYKTQVFGLAKFLNVPEEILIKTPSAGLWEGQTDEGQFEFSYKTADEVLYFHFERDLSREEILKKGYDEKAVEKVFWWINRGNFKSRLPYSPE